MKRLRRMTTRTTRKTRMNFTKIRMRSRKWCSIIRVTLLNLGSNSRRRCTFRMRIMNRTRKILLSMPICWSSSSSSSSSNSNSSSSKDTRGGSLVDTNNNRSSSNMQIPSRSLRFRLIWEEETHRSTWTNTCKTCSRSVILYKTFSSSWTEMHPLSMQPWIKQIWLE